MLVDPIACLRESVATTRADLIPSRETHSSCYQVICRGLHPATGLRCLDALAADQSRFAGGCQNGIDSVPFAKHAWAGRRIWQRLFWEHLIRDDARHVEYYHINPLTHGLVERVRDWPYSSFHRDVDTGAFPHRLGWRYGCERRDR
jgi:putative transposase